MNGEGSLEENDPQLSRRPLCLEYPTPSQRCEVDVGTKLAVKIIQEYNNDKKAGARKKVWPKVVPETAGFMGELGEPSLPVYGTQALSLCSTRPDEILPSYVGEGGGGPICAFFSITSSSSFTGEKGKPPPKRQPGQQQTFLGQQCESFAKKDSRAISCLARCRPNPAQATPDELARDDGEEEEDRLQPISRADSCL